MEFRTTFKIEPSASKITYRDPVMFIGSCFAISIGNCFEHGKMPVMINPAGTVYNPVSVSNTLDIITSGEKYNPDNLYRHHDLWISFDHHGDFSSADPEALIERINNRSLEALKLLSEAKFLFITFGTARVFRWTGSGRIVSNCHKIPASEFTNELLSPESIITVWSQQLGKLKLLFPTLEVVFTISPVRHWKDGPHGNQVSKSVLFLAVEELLKHPARPSYFPAYELVMDDLRDYRFYDVDMLHPSTAAIDYIWEAFCRCYFTSETGNLWQEVAGISRAMMHRIRSGNRDQLRTFAANILAKIEPIILKHPYIKMDKEIDYFSSLL
jgi:hypothetical protein